ncbi:MAG: hypothetical protein LBS53_07535 [Synergistaceae bacterium]|nr:hypothetical protein [Synergistaceae bacterium]
MTNSASVKDRLKNLAVKLNRPFDYLLMHYFIERLLYRLSTSPYVDNFINNIDNATLHIVVPSRRVHAFNSPFLGF